MFGEGFQIDLANLCHFNRRTDVALKFVCILVNWYFCPFQRAWEDLRSRCIFKGCGCTQWRKCHWNIGAMVKVGIVKYLGCRMLSWNRNMNSSPGEISSICFDQFSTYNDPWGSKWPALIKRFAVLDTLFKFEKIRDPLQGSNAASNEGKHHGLHHCPLAAGNSQSNLIFGLVNHTRKNVIRPWRRGWFYFHTMVCCELFHGWEGILFNVIGGMHNCLSVVISDNLFNLVLRCWAEKIKILNIDEVDNFRDEVYECRWCMKKG